MKPLSFRQLQLRVLTVLFLLFSSTIIGYRYFLELPKLEKNIALLAEKELKLLHYGVQTALTSLSRLTYDYSVWTSTYEFMHDINEEYIDENMVPDTFNSLKIDGIFYLNENFEPILTKGLHHLSDEELTFSFYDFKKYPLNSKMLPTPISGEGVPHKEGFINTQYGPALFSAFQIRDSNKFGDNRGFLIFIQLIEEPFLDLLNQSTLTTISIDNDILGKNLNGLPLWNEKVKIEDVKPYRHILFQDMNGLPVTVLKIKHSKGELPPLINEHSLIFISILSLFIYLFYHLITHTIIKPVKKLALSIKLVDEELGFKLLEEKFSVKELMVVSNNVNQLINTVQQQNDLLRKQATTDQLTNLMNRHGLLAVLEIHKDLCIRQGITFAVVMCDIDHFKQYNDHFGHLEGDQALVDVGQVLKLQCKRANDYCARYGGEEFTLLFSDMSENDLQEKLLSISDAMKTLNIAHPKSQTAPHMTFSCGATIIKATDVVNHSLPISDIFKCADQALYEAKSMGRNNFVIKEFVTLASDEQR